MPISIGCKVLFMKKSDRLLGDQLFRICLGHEENLAGIEDYTRIATHLQPEQIVKYGELTLRENQIAYADPGFFRLFDFELLKGDKKDLSLYAPASGNHRTYCP